MPPLATALVRTGLAIKLDQVKRATSSYLRDRSEQGTGIAVSYATAAGLYVAAGIFLIATLLVGAAALFRWVEINYGLFPAFGVTAGWLLLLAIICAVVAGARLRKPARQFPSLSSRLRVAVSATPGRQGPGPVQRAEFKPSTSPPAPTRRGWRRAPVRDVTPSRPPGQAKA